MSANVVSSFFAALLFGIGLAISGMIDPKKVQDFLDFTGRWNPSLAFVMGGALMVASVGFLLLKKRGLTLNGERLHWPTRKDLDAKLIGGAALFGIGWGAAGFCPGPALGSLVFLSADVFIFVGGMAAGMIVAQRYARKD